MALDSSLVAQMVERLPTMRETRVQSLGQEDLLEKKMATHSSILAWKIPWTEEPGRLQSMGVTKSQTRLINFTSLHSINNIHSVLVCVCVCIYIYIYTQYKYIQ